MKIEGSTSQYIRLVTEASKKAGSMASLMSNSVNQWNRENGDYALRVDKFELAPDSVVFDVGAYKGDWSKRMFDKFPGIKIIAFEPIEHYCDEYIKRMDTNNYILHRIGLSNCSDNFSISDTGLSTSVNVEGDIKISVENICDYVSRYKSIDVLKLNIEGSEYPCLNELIKTGLINNIKSIIVQFHPIDDDVEKSCNAWNDTASSLSNSHDLNFCFPFIWERWDLKV
jgi:FkbM family methyltransferase